jgi:CBS domain-containing protein
MAQYDEKLDAISAVLRRGVAPPPETVREVLRWFGAERRGYRVVRTIRRELKKRGLTTAPDFEYAYIDGRIELVSAPAPDGAQAVADAEAVVTDPTYRLARLESANRTPLSIKPDASLRQAVTLMMTNDFSQLPVMATAREVKGMVSWKSIGNKLALGLPCVAVRDCTEPARIAKADDSLFSVLATIQEHDYVLVQAHDRTICGIVTASDVNDQFRLLAEPFLMVGEIEHGIRRLLHGKFTSKELEETKLPGDARPIEGVADLAFGEFIRLLEQETRWNRVKLAIDRVEFLSRLNKVREIRNDVMHFDPDGLDPSDMDLLRDFAVFLRRLRELGAG